MKVLAVLVLALAGCAYSGAQGSPTPAPTSSPGSTTVAGPTKAPTANPDDHGAQHRAQAEQDLQQWADFMADRPSDTVVFIRELTNGGGWNGAGAENAKEEFYSGLIEASVDLPSDVPPPGQVRWADGTTEEVPLISAADALSGMIGEFRGDDSQPQCGTCLQVTGATLTTRKTLTWRGEAEVPVWQFEFVGRDKPIDPISFIALKNRVGPGDWKAWGRFAPQLDGAYGGPDDTAITVAFGGGACDSSHSVEAVESDAAIVPIISTTASGGACTMQRISYTLVLNLTSPLGDRAVLDLENGWPAPVYTELPPEWPTPEPSGGPTFPPQSPNPTAAMSGRSVCPGAVTVVGTNLTGDAADEVEMLQGTYEEQPGFLGVVFDGTKGVVIVDSKQLVEWQQKLASSGVAVAPSCIDTTLLASVMAVLPSLASRPVSAGYNGLDDSIDVFGVEPDELVNALETQSPGSGALALAALANGTLHIEP